MPTSNMPQSWGRFPRVKHSHVVPVYWRHEVPQLDTFETSILPFAYGRSYGDSCLNEGGISLDVSNLRHFISFDEEEGLLRCEAGISLAEVLEVMVPRGWFLPVTPGTKFVSVGGAIANDVHGKNHHKAGTFGCHVTQLELLRSDGTHLLCSPTENSELFQATIGGLGLTGVILWAEFRLKRVQNPYIQMDNIQFGSLDEYRQVAEESDKDFEYTVSWVVCLGNEKEVGRGIYTRGNHDTTRPMPTDTQAKHLPLAVPFDFPSFTLNRLTIRAFNLAYYNKQLVKRVHKIEHYDPFFYPLDAIHTWNRMYGKRGFFQYQFVIPFEGGYDAMAEIMREINHSGEGSFLTVLKSFGDVRSPGMLSFPRPGLTLALDFANHGSKTFRLLDRLDALVNAAGGHIYPAKDARMHPEDFQRYFPAGRSLNTILIPSSLQVSGVVSLNP
ncbi:FAD-linked oxidase [Ktedonospora formicarum]|uniref:FAD-linked oxidase n=1 Tax=Ktedonospora formicarum TaxID=2778364 RepID=A0A8J3MTE3_9CHLR|nr:FAD-binding oxidoreductase [Ktedonospora formicarum]GHO45523.1 FAD-linked oxidase [Ktedonospora formicarum]